MRAEFEEIKDLWDPETSQGRDEERVRELSDAYVEGHPEEFTGYAEKDLPTHVKALEVFREAGFEEEEFRVQVWIWHYFEPQDIGGTYRAKVRVQ